ncbi:hypothetical protein PISMIDRAFT_269453 [Pisolithus microcarpus 441]|uniref:Uncharacterized protein n=1 Tax=Pisolithus microcarpus 441 TaxID=765257 RepID=A0A0C9XV30_9AGAM|nr:hypothetical protein PISMIDRAFT_269453 [Pisolithus microcarpus 441]
MNIVWPCRYAGIKQVSKSLISHRRPYELRNEEPHRAQRNGSSLCTMQGSSSRYQVCEVAGKNVGAGKLKGRAKLMRKICTSTALRRDSFA